MLGEKLSVLGKHPLHLFANLAGPFENIHHTIGFTDQLDRIIPVQTHIALDILIANRRFPLLAQSPHPLLHRSILRHCSNPGTTGSTHTSRHHYRE